MNNFSCILHMRRKIKIPDKQTPSKQTDPIEAPSFHSEPRKQFFGSEKMWIYESHSIYIL